MTKLFAPLAMKVAGGIVAALVLALVFVTIRADSISADRERLRTELAQSNARHSITRLSLQQLQDEMAAIVHAGALRESRVADALVEQRKRSELLHEEAQRILRETPSVRCEPPRSILGSDNL